MENRFQIRDSRGTRYEIVETDGPSGPTYRTTDGARVERLDRTNFVIHRRNPKTNEPTIEAHR